MIYLKASFETLGAHGVVHTSAELGSAKGAGDAGTLYTASTPSNETLEDIAAATSGPKWFQHGGRGLGGVPAAVELLPAVVKAVNGRVPVIMDSGLRRGTDVFKALALGADAVALGRPVLYGLSLGGAQGVKSVYDRIGAELSRTMMIAGVENIKEIDSKFLYNKAGAEKA